MIVSFRHRMGLGGANDVQIYIPAMQKICRSSVKERDRKVIFNKNKQKNVSKKL